jgi:uncharacterized phage protein (TIGR02218 family)
MAFDAALKAHLQTGNTTVARAWRITRRDGLVMGFTDHDQDLSFEGTVFKAETGLTAQALAQSTGLSVDNAEAVGSLSDGAISEADLFAGRYDSALVTAWLVNWGNPVERSVVFRGSIGEISQAGPEFRAELRGLTENLNVPQGRVYQRPCSARLGDAQCGFDLSSSGYFVEAPVLGVETNRLFTFAVMPQFAEGWFSAGRVEVTSGPAAGLIGVVKSDKTTSAGRVIEMWSAFRADVNVGDNIRVEAGCDKRAETCKVKFSNFLNFRGFPHIPGEDWMMAHPRRAGDNDGGSLVR